MPEPAGSTQCSSEPIAVAGFIGWGPKGANGGKGKEIGEEMEGTPHFPKQLMHCHCP